jgi:hypothetical protein
MPKFQFTKTLAQLVDALDGPALDELGRETGFLKRRRDITPAKLVPSLIAALGSGRVTTLADLCFWFNELTGSNVAEKTFWDRLANPEFPVMMDNFVGRLTGQLVLRSLRFLPNSPFSQFDRILAQDGSSLAVHSALAKIFPGRFTKVSPAAVELHPTYDLLTEAPVVTWLAQDTQSERDYLPDPSTLAGSLLLADRGYPSWNYLAEVRDKGGSFIMRLKGGLKPNVIGFYRDGEQVDLAEAVDLQDYCAAHDDAVLDLLVRPRGDHGTFRLTILRTPKGRTFLINNLPATDFPPNVVGLAYRLRWQIELMFKEWKSYANLHRFSTANEQITEGLLWASIATALLKRFVAKAAQMVGEVAVSTLKAASRLPAILPKLIAAVFAGAESLEEAFAHALEALMLRAKRSNTKRERRIGRQQLGLRPVYGR